jgi:hypothetical protein
MPTIKVQITVPTAEEKGRVFIQKWVSGFRLTLEEAQELRRLKRGLAVEGVISKGRPVETSSAVFSVAIERSPAGARSRPGGNAGADVRLYFGGLVSSRRRAVVSSLTQVGFA